MKCPHCGKETETKARLDLEKIFWDFRYAYPPRDGGQRWPEAYQAFRRLVKRGVDSERLVVAAALYYRHCTHRRNVGTQYVMQAATFLGRGGGWEEDWITETPFDQARRQLQEQT